MILIVSRTGQFLRCTHLTETVCTSVQCTHLCVHDFSGLSPGVASRLTKLNTPNLGILTGDNYWVVNCPFLQISSKLVKSEVMCSSQNNVNSASETELIHPSTEGLLRPAGPVCFALYDEFFHRVLCILFIKCCCIEQCFLFILNILMFFEGYSHVLSTRKTIIIDTVFNEKP